MIIVFPPSSAGMSLFAINPGVSHDGHQTPAIDVYARSIFCGKGEAMSLPAVLARPGEEESTFRLLVSRKRCQHSIANLKQLLVIEGAV